MIAWLIFAKNYGVIAANDKGDSVSHDGSEGDVSLPWQREVMSLEGLATLAPRWVPLIGRRHFFLSFFIHWDFGSNARHRGEKNLAS